MLVTNHFMFVDDQLQFFVSFSHIGESILSIDQIFAHLVAFTFDLPKFLFQLFGTFAHAIEDPMVLLDTITKQATALDMTFVESGLCSLRGVSSLRSNNDQRRDLSDQWRVRESERHARTVAYRLAEPSTAKKLLQNLHDLGWIGETLLLL